MTIREVLARYKSDFTKYWEDEKYKWVAVQHFQKNWNIEAEDFAAMLKESFSQTYNLLQGGMYYANKMLCVLAQQDPEKMRSLFRLLYNENLPLVDRLQPFRTGCEELLEEFRKNTAEPEKAKNHYQDLRALCVYLSFRYPETYFLFKYRMYTGFRKLIDFKETSQEKDSEVRKYDNYARMCQAVLEEIKADTELQQMQRERVGNETDCYSDPEFHLLAQTIIYVGSGMSDDAAQTDEPAKGAAVADEDLETKRYWLYSPGNGASIWDECYQKGIMAIGWDEIGELTKYCSKDEMKQAMKEEIDPTLSYMNAAHATWQFVNEMKPGDIVFAKKGMHLIVGRGVVESGYVFDTSRQQYKNIRKVKWTHKGEWPHPGQAVMKVLTDITPYTDYVAQLNALFESDTIDDIEEQVFEYPAYDAEDFLAEVFMDEGSYETKFRAVPHLFVFFFFFARQNLLRASFAFRPSESGFELKRGAFYNFCKQAEIDSENEYFFIIDEINRGNLSKIFGELFMLIESDKRGVELQLLYSDEKFSVPSNVYIIGMMNTADRSLAMLDYALRRRFAFFEMKPGFNTDGFREYRMGLSSEKFDRLINCVENLNAAIAADEALGEGFCIGHSYFCNLKKTTDQALSGIVEYELIPLLKEYWFDEPIKVKDWVSNLRSAIK